MASPFPPEKVDPTLAGLIFHRSRARMQRVVVPGADHIGGVVSGVKALQTIFEERHPLSWQASPFLQAYGEWRAPAHLRALEDMRRPVESVFSVGEALDDFWLEFRKCVGKPLLLPPYGASGYEAVDPDRRNAFFPAVSEPTLFQDLPSSGTVAVSTQALLVCTAMDPHFFRTLKIIDPDWFLKLSPLTEFRSGWDASQGHNLTRKITALGNAVEVAQTRWRDYGETIISRPRRRDKVLNLICARYPIIYLGILLAHIILTMYFNAGTMAAPAFIFVVITYYLDALAALMRAVFVDPSSPYNMRRDVAQAILTIRKELNAMEEALYEPMQILTDVEDDLRKRKGDNGWTFSKEQRDRSLLRLMLTYGLSSGGRIKNELRDGLSKLNNSVAERQAERDRRRSFLQMTFDCITFSDSDGSSPEILLRDMDNPSPDVMLTDP
ncbi:hypothetical protein EV121DRAFT_287976 [Schizophyllum commune]